MPSKAPAVNVTSPTPTSLYVTWQPIDKEYLHGIDGGYCIYIQMHSSTDETRNWTVENNIRDKTISDLKPYRQYKIQVAAKTTPGCGVKSPKMSIYTQEDSKFNSVHKSNSLIITSYLLIYNALY